MKIKKLSKNDTSLFCSFFETLSSLSPSPAIAEEPLQAIMDDLEKKDKHIFIMVDDGKVIGTLSVLIERKLSRGGALCAHIEDVATHEQHRGKGIASSLMKKAIEYTTERGCYKIVLTCREHLVGFYQKEGFKIKGVQMECRKD